MIISKILHSMTYYKVQKMWGNNAILYVFIVFYGVIQFCLQNACSLRMGQHLKGS